MFKFSFITRSLLTLMLFSPVLTFLSFNYTNSFSVSTWLIIFTIPFGTLYLFNYWNRIQFPQFSLFALAFSLYILVWSFFNSTMQDKGILLTILYNKHLSVFFIVVIIYNTTFTTKFIKQAIYIFKITVVVTFGVSLIQVYIPTFYNTNFYMDRMSGSEMDIAQYLLRRNSIYSFEKNSFGLSFIPLLAVLSGYLLYTKDKKYTLYLVLGGVSSMLTNTRYVMVAFVIISLQIILHQKLKLSIIAKYLIIIIVFSTILFVVLSKIGYNLSDWYNSRLLSEGSLTETTRFKAIGNFLIFFPQAPFFGNGGILTEKIIDASAAIGSSQIHVGYLIIFIYWGLIGSFFLLFFWFLLAKRLYRTAKNTGYWGSFMAFLAFLWSFATMTVDYIFFYGLIFALVFDKFYSDLHFKKKQIASMNTEFKRANNQNQVS